MTSPLARTPCSRARRSAATDSAAERCSRWIGCSSKAASARSRSTITDSAIDGYAVKPSSAATAPSCTCPPRESVGSSQWSASGRPVIDAYCSARRIIPADETGTPSSENATAPASASSPISVSSSPDWPRVIAARKPTGTRASLFAGLDERAERRGRVDDRIGVRHREDRAVAARRRGGGAARDRLLVLAARRAQVHVRIDEGGREHETRRRRRPGARSRRRVSRDCGDHAVVDADVERRVDALGGIEHARAAKDDVRRLLLARPEHHATSAAASARTPTGPPVSTS